MKIFPVHEDSDAVFHEETESVISLMIRVTNDAVSSIYRCYFNPFFCKNVRKWQ
jgi:hypothetical protein